MPKPLRFTQHALVAMRERQLEMAWVERAVHAPLWTETEPNDPEIERRFRPLPERDGRILRVAVVETAAEIRILSAFLDRRARPR